MKNIKNNFVLSAVLCTFALPVSSFAFIGSIGKAVSSAASSASSSVSNAATSTTGSVSSAATSATSSVGSVATSAASSATNAATTTTGNVASGVQSATTATGFNASATGGTITIGNTHIGSIGAGVTDGQVGVGGNVNVTGIAGGGDVSVGASADGVSGSASASASAGNVGSVSTSANASVSTSDGNIGASASQSNAANVSVSGVGSVSGSSHTGGQTSVGVSGVSGSASTSGSGSASVSSVGSVSNSSGTSASGSAGVSGVTGSSATSSKTAASVTGIGSVSSSKTSTATGDVGASGITGTTSISSNSSGSVTGIGSVSSSKTSTSSVSVGTSGITGSTSTSSGNAGTNSSLAGTATGDFPTSTTGSTIGDVPTSTTGSATGDVPTSTTGSATGDVPTSTTGSATGDVPTSTTGSATGDVPTSTTGSATGDVPTSTTGSATGDVPTTTTGSTTGDVPTTTTGSTTGDATTSTTGDNATASSDSSSTTGASQDSSTSDNSSTSGDATASTGGNDGGEDPVDEPSDNQESPNQERSVSFNVAPLVFGDFTMFSRAVNLKNTSVKNYNNNSLEIYPKNSGYLATKVVHYNLGLGVAGYWNFENATGLLDNILPIVGVALIKDKKVEMSGYVKDRDDLDRFKLAMPSKAEIIDAWNIGDNLSYETSGGVMFFGGISSYALGLGQTFIAVGSQKYHVEKISQDVVLVEVIGSETKSAVSSLGLSLSQLSKTYLNRYTNGISFLINLKDDHTRLAYEDLIKGNLIPIQELAEDKYNDDVHLLSETSDKLIGKLISFKVGLPFVPLLSFESIKGKLHGLSRVKELQNNTRVETDYGVYLSGSKGRFINKYKENLKIFYMGNAVLKDSDSEILGEKSTGHFLWANLNDSSKIRKVKKSLKKLSVATSFPEIFDIKVPGKNRTKLGYSQVAAQFTYNGDFIKHLHYLNSTSVGLDSVKDNALVLLKDKFKNGLSSDYCRATARNGRDGIKNCEREVKSKVSRIVRNIEKTLNQIKSVSSKRERSIQFAKFGKQVWENPFVFRSMMKLASQCGLSINFDVVGKNIAYFNKKFTFDKTDSCKFYNY